MRIGFTGTRNGMTDEQAEAFAALIQDLSPTEFHHGDCVGADDEAANMVRMRYSPATCPIISHPPDKDTFRARNPHADFTCEPKGYHARNRDIINASQLLIATPKERFSQVAGGTWYTVRHALVAKKPVHVIWPDGRVEVLTWDGK